MNVACLLSHYGSLFDSGKSSMCLFSHTELKVMHFMLYSYNMTLLSYA